MKINLKTITGKQQTLEVKDSATVKDVKELLKDEYDAATLRLCFNGAVVADDVTVQSLEMTEKDAFVIAGKKSKVAKAGTANQQQQKQQQAEAEAEAEAKTKEQQQQQQQQEPPAESTATTDAVVVAGSNATATTGSSNAPPVAAGAVNKELVDNLVAMGFEDRAQVALALQAAFMNVDRAVEYLCTGIPAGAQQALRDSMMMNQHLAGGGVSEVTNSQLRAALNAIPQFPEIKATYLQNREVLPVILEQMAQHYPELYTMVMSDIEGFQRIMEESDSEEEGFTDAVEATNDLADRMPQEISITQEDREALVNLVEIGGGAWDQQAAMLVYLACRKNQEIAAAVLLEHGGVPPELLAEILAQQQAQ